MDAELQRANQEIAALYALLDKEERSKSEQYKVDNFEKELARLEDYRKTIVTALATATAPTQESQYNPTSTVKGTLKRESEFPEEESVGMKKRRLSISQTLVTSVGADFYFSDRDASFEILASSVEQRFYCHKLGLKDKALHKLPFLADGPGSGKSRFLQELPKAFACYIKNMKQSVYSKSKYEESLEAVVSYIKNTPASFDDFKNTLSAALFINVSFGNGSEYVQQEKKLTIQQSLCLRILYPYYADKYSSFISFYDAFLNKHISVPSLTLANILKIINKENHQCIVLGIDEVNYLYNISKEHFKELFADVGYFSSSYSPFFVPVLAGTVIGPMKSVVTYSKYPPLHIPLPLLSYDSCLHILATKDKKYEKQVKTNHSLRQVVSNIGGHCRALEILFRVLSKHQNQSYPNFWDIVINDVRHTLSEMYPMSSLPQFGMAIAFYYLSMHVDEEQQVSNESSLTFLNLEEYGLLKLERLKDDTVKMKIPFVFVLCYLQSSTANEYSRFWTHLLISKKIYWQAWEDFNCSYMAFRLSLFSKLGKSTIPLSQFLSGAQMNLPVDIMLKIPSINDIKTTILNNQYPSTIQTEFPIGTCVLNASGAAFDAFVYLETTAGKLLVAQQMKLASPDSANPQKITNDLVNEEYQKVNNSIARHIPNTDFILVVFGRCEGDYHVDRLPSKCAVVGRDEFQEFYGEAYCQHLNN